MLTHDEDWAKNHSSGLDDELKGRPGAWMQTLSGRRFFPLDPRPEDFDIGDIANGLATEARYGGQGRLERRESVAEHCSMLCDWGKRQGWAPLGQFCLLMHDAAEGLIKDQPRALKKALEPTYSDLEAKVEICIFGKYAILTAMTFYEDEIKTADRRIVWHEKRAVQRTQLEWAYDKFEPLEGIGLEHWTARRAKREWLKRWERLAKTLRKQGYKIPTEEYVI